MSSTPLDLSIIILSFNNADIIDECLTRTEASAEISTAKHHHKIEIIVVDNGSKDGSLAIIKTKHPKVKLIELPENIGPARGNNIGLKAATSPYLLLINSDTFLDKNSLADIFDYIAVNNDWGVLTVKLVFGDGRFQAFGGFLPTPLRTIFWTLGIESLPIIKNLILPFYQYNQQFYQTEQTFGWAANSFFLIKRNVYEKTLGLDNRMFVHMEDVEWCQRIVNAGYKIHYTPEITVTHLGGKSTKKFDEFSLLQQHLAGLKYFHTKHYPLTWFIVKIFLKLGLILRASYFYITGKQLKFKAYQQAISQF
jgi:N-acetylglucosaminyl-diphospho-decaprenol L-rhamnosyltransferase